MKIGKSLTITYLAPVSFASLNGSDKEADNISSIKKISVGVEEYPYVSSQAVRRALRDQLASLGWNLSEGVAATISKGAATTQQSPELYIDDDLFGFMGAEKGDGGAKGRSIKRTSAVRVSPLVSFIPYRGDLDFGTNYMGVKAGGDPNIFETEIHSGLYRGTVLVELDRVGCGESFLSEIDNEEKAKRVNGFLDALKNLWTSGRQSRFLADISPKFIAAALLTVKNPIFLESVRLNEDQAIDSSLLAETVADFKNEIIEYVCGARKGLFLSVPDEAVSVGEAFEKITSWVNGYYGVKQSEVNVPI